MVKDHRFGVEEGDVEKILGGDLKGFVEEFARRKMYSDFGLCVVCWNENIMRCDVSYFYQ